MKELNTEGPDAPIQGIRFENRDDLVLFTVFRALFNDHEVAKKIHHAGQHDSECYDIVAEVCTQALREAAVHALDLVNQRIWKNGPEEAQEGYSEVDHVFGPSKASIKEAINDCQSVIEDFEFYGEGGFSHEQRFDEYKCESLKALVEHVLSKQSFSDKILERPFAFQKEAANDED